VCIYHLRLRKSCNYSIKSRVPGISAPPNTSVVLRNPQSNQGPQRTPCIKVDDPPCPWLTRFVPRKWGHFWGHIKAKKNLTIPLHCRLDPCPRCPVEAAPSGILSLVPGCRWIGHDHGSWSDEPTKAGRFRPQYEDVSGPSS
jgi:hypothetical protein